jgi:acid phosphatase family membrane protein YuiD
MPLVISLKAAQVKAFFENPIFLSTASSWFVAQITKMLIFLLGHRRRRSAREAIEIAFWRTGGMPSSHSAVVCSLTTSVALVEGINSNLFVFSFWFAMVVLRDAMGVRRAAGLQAKALNHLGKQTAEKADIDFHPVKEIQGHSPLEVVVGGLLGIFIAAGFVLL